MEVFRFASVDDDVMVKSVMESIPKLGCGLVHCWHAFNSEEAVNKSIIDPVDILVVDCRLGKESGIELIKILKIIKKQTKVVLLSGYLNSSIYCAAVSLGVNSILIKGEPLDVIHNTIKKTALNENVYSEKVKLLAVSEQAQSGSLTEFQRTVLLLYSQLKTIKEVSFKLNKKESHIDSVIRRLRIKHGSKGNPLTTRQLLHQFLSGQLG